MEWTGWNAGSIDSNLAVKERATVDAEGRDLREHARMLLRYQNL